MQFKVVTIRKVRIVCKKLSLLVFPFILLFVVSCVDQFIAAIEGTGDGSKTIEGNGSGPTATAKTTSLGSISAIGDIDGKTIIVNGIEYDTTSAAIVIDGNENSLSNPLLLGQVLIANGQREKDGTTGLVQATEIRYTSNVIGPIAAIDTANLSLAVLGQRVQIDNNTVFGDGIINFNQLTHQQIVRISGFVDSEGNIFATRIDALPQVQSYQVTGIVKTLDLTDMRFSINGLIVSYQSAEIDNIIEGSIVKVNGQLTDGDVLQADSVQQLEVVLGEAGREVDLAGLITRFDSISDFDVNGLPVTMTDMDDILVENGDLNDLALDARVEVYGLLNEQGITVVNRIVIINTAPLKFSGFLEAETEAQYSIKSSSKDIGLWLTLSELDGFADLMVRNSTGDIVCLSTELSAINDGFCYLGTDGTDEWTVYVFGNSATHYNLTGHFRRAEFGPIEEIIAGEPKQLKQYPGDRNLYRISTEHAPKDAFLAVAVNGLEDGGRLIISSSDQPSSNNFSCQLRSNFNAKTCWLDINGVSQWYLNIESSADTNLDIHVDFIQPVVMQAGNVIADTVDKRQGALYRFDVAQSDNSVAVLVDDPDGPISLLGNSNNPPTDHDFACSAGFFDVSDLQCIADNNGAYVWYFLVEGEIGASYQLSMLSQTDTVQTQELKLNESFDINQAAGVIATYKIPQVDNNNEVLIVEVTDLTDADFEVYVKRDPDIFDAYSDCVLIATSVDTRRCRVINETDEEHFTVIVKSAKPGRYRLSAATQPIIDLSVGGQVRGEITPEDASAGLIYRVRNDEAEFLTLLLSNKTGPVGFFAEREFIPNEKLFECADLFGSLLPGVCTLGHVLEAPLYILVKGEVGSQFTLSAKGNSDE